MYSHVTVFLMPWRKEILQFAYPKFNTEIDNELPTQPGCNIVFMFPMLLWATSISVHVHFIVNTAGPSAAPTGFAVLSVTNSSVTLTWNNIPCVDRNGPFLGYVIEYTPDGGMASTTLLTGSNQLTGLAACTNYTLRIAAQNDASTGEFSSPLSVITNETGEE